MLIQVTTVTITTTAASATIRRARNFTIEKPSRRAKLTAPGAALAAPTDPAVRRFPACDFVPARRGFLHGNTRVDYGRQMKRALPLAVLALLGAGATALAAQGDDPYDSPEPAVTAAQVLKLPDSAPGCGSVRNATVRVTPPNGAILGFVRIAVDGSQAARLTGVPRAASATVRIPQSGARLSVSSE